MNEDEFDYSVFPPPVRTEPCQLYLISPQDVGGASQPSLERFDAEAHWDGAPTCCGDRHGDGDYERFEAHIGLLPNRVNIG